MKNKSLVNLLIPLCLLLPLVSCNGGDSKVEFNYKLVKLEPKASDLTSLPRPENLNSLDDYSLFLDYVCFNNEPNTFIYTSVTDEFKTQLATNHEYLFRWGGQYGSLSHNFIEDYDLSKLEQNLIGAKGHFLDYGGYRNEVNSYDYKTYDYTYYQTILKDDSIRNFTYNDFYLSQNNKGYIKVNNSDQLFYVISQGYMPYIENNQELETLFSSILGILNRLIKEGMNEYDKYLACYSYLTNSVYYDYQMLNNKNGVNPRLFRCYYLEGSLLDGLATCDGLTKALQVMCSLEGITSYHIGAVGYRGGHAFAYTNIDDKYYLSCVTNGSKIVNNQNQKFLDHTKLYFLSDLKPNLDWDFDSDSHLDISSQIDTKFNYWKHQQVKIDDKTYSLEVKDADTGLKILSYIDNIAKEEKVNLDIEIKTSYSINQEIQDQQSFKNRYVVNNNGIFEGDKLYSYVFLGGEGNE